ncbi:hypothetical protein PV327_011459 [Microctonus hyperodae]|uniref:Uncharacterized protein n=1 Tax=Microctonus hyperodae TaxID=165561 RepID=A0AA39KQ14_MICHY|nr:hypothetical protein PV327_011459 [Microctonus hyperodae]
MGTGVKRGEVEEGKVGEKDGNYGGQGGEVGKGNDEYKGRGGWWECRGGREKCGGRGEGIMDGDGGGREEIVGVKLKGREEKKMVTEAKKKLRGRVERVEDDLTEEERKARWRIEEEAGKERRKGKNVQIGYLKIWVNGVVRRWDEIEEGAEGKGWRLLGRTKGMGRIGVNGDMGVGKILGGGAKLPAKGLYVGGAVGEKGE